MAFEHASDLINDDHLLTDRKARRTSARKASKSQRKAARAEKRALKAERKTARSLERQAPSSLQTEITPAPCLAPLVDQLESVFNMDPLAEAPHSPQENPLMVALEHATSMDRLDDIAHCVPVHEPSPHEPYPRAGTKDSWLTFEYKSDPLKYALPKISPTIASVSGAKALPLTAAQVAPAGGFRFTVKEKFSSRESERRSVFKRLKNMQIMRARFADGHTVDFLTLLCENPHKLSRIRKQALRARDYWFNHVPIEQQIAEARIHGYADAASETTIQITRLWSNHELGALLESFKGKWNAQPTTA